MSRITYPNADAQKQSASNCMLSKLTDIPRNWTGEGTGGLRGFFCGRGTPRGLGLLSVAIVPVPVTHGVVLISQSFSERDLRVDIQDGV